MIDFPPLFFLFPIFDRFFVYSIGKSIYFFFFLSFYFPLFFALVFYTTLTLSYTRVRCETIVTEGFVKYLLPPCCSIAQSVIFN